MFETPAQCIHIAGAKLFEHVIELLVNPAQETENLAEDTSTGCSPVFAMAIVDLFLAAVRVIKSVGQACVDFIKMFAQKKSHHCWDDRAREKIRSEHGEDHSHGERLKKKSGCAAEEKDRHENDANAKS